jgi:hypothetical protein
VIKSKAIRYEELNMFIRRLVFLFTAIFLFSSTAPAKGPGLLAEQYGEGDFRLAGPWGTADIVIDPADHAVTIIAARDLASDIEKVTGKKPRIIHKVEGARKRVVIIGSLDKSRTVAGLAERDMPGLSEIRGKWESFVMQTVEGPFSGVDKALVIAGSDRRGTAFGVYELSQQIGMSPWSWWADAAPDKREELIIKGGRYRQGPPSVKYRGIFINDEDFGIQPWAAKTFEPETGDMGPKTYARVFELLLRLKANHLWPAMHKCTHAFNYYPENKKVAHKYAIVMGSSHCEQMLRNNVDEWERDGKGLWAYQLNRKNILSYWEERVRENGKYENIYTLGMRAIHDSPMYAFGGERTRTKLLENIIRDQRKLLTKHVNRDVTEVPQVLCLYNEVLDYYRQGLEVPDDVTIMFADDNHGYIRHLPGPEDRSREGGSGVYYHVSYWGPPQDYLWLATTPPGLVREEMTKAYRLGAKRTWMLNVGDIKPAEILTEFFLQMAWDVDRWDRNSQKEYLREFAAREFGGLFADDIAAIMDAYYLLNYQRKPSHMGFNMIGEKFSPVQDPEFSHFHYGDEAEKRVAAFRKIESRAAAIYEKLPDHKRNAFYQLVLYPVRCSYYLNEKIIYAHKSRVYARQGRTVANRLARLAREDHQGIIRETDYYNNRMKGGKWKSMMTYDPKELPVFDMPDTGRVKPMEQPRLGVIPQGSEEPLKNNGELPGLLRYTRKSYFIDLFNKGEGTIKWGAQADKPWLKLDRSSGEFAKQQRIWVSADYEAAPTGTPSANISISGAGSDFIVKAPVINPLKKLEPGTVFVQDNGVISMNAEHYNVKHEGRKSSFRKVTGMGRTGVAMAVRPFDAMSIKDASRSYEYAPSLEYLVHVTKPGEARVIVQVAPTHAVTKGRRLATAVALDGGAPEIIEYDSGSYFLGYSWSKDVLNAARTGEARMYFPKGLHSLYVFGIDPSVVVDKIIVDFGGMKGAYLGPPETQGVQ